MDTLLPIGSLYNGQSGRVREILGRSDEVHRLQELGMQSGTEVEMVQRGSPCIIRLAGQKLCFRSDELSNVLVQTGGTI